MTARREPSEAPVLVVGGGLVGLVMGLLLQHQGVPFVQIEQQLTPSILPRSRGIHVRSMEIFRGLGLEGAVQEAAQASWKVGRFGGARRGPSLLTSRSIFPKGFRPNVERTPSPSTFGACPQTTLEAVLREPLVRRGADLRFGYTLQALIQDESGVVADVADAQGQTVQIHTRYLIGADGGRSTVRRALGLGTESTPARQHHLNIFFRADLTDRMAGRTFSQCEVENDQLRGVLISKDNATEWSFHLEYDPAVTDPAQFTPEQLIRFARAAIGDERLPVHIIATGSWSTAVRIAERYRVGRTFLVGDAAHLMPPWGGFNGNTGIADAHNLGWKLAEVLAGRATASLLDSYETERRPVAVRNARQALLRSDFYARFDIETPTNHETFRQLQSMDTLMMKYPYPPATAQPVEQLSAQLGTRFPHAWIVRDGQKISILDLFGRGMVTLAGPAAEGRDLLQAGRDFVFEDGTTWPGLTGLPQEGAVTIRPDGIVAARSDTPPPGPSA